MVVVITIRDVPDDVRDILAQRARERGQSLQAFLLGVLNRQAGFARNRQLLSEISQEMDTDGGADPDAPSAAELIARARARRDLPDDPGIPGRSAQDVA